MSALLIVLAGVAVVVAIRSFRHGWSDRHTVEEHHRTLDTLGEIAHRQDNEGRPTEGPARIGLPPAQPHIRVIPPGGGQPTAEGPPALSPARSGQPVRWPPAQPLPSGDATMPGPEPTGDAITPASALTPDLTPELEASPHQAAPPVEPLSPAPPVAPIPIVPANQEPESFPASALSREVPPLSAPITPPPRAPSRPLPVPPEPAAPLVALTVDGGEVADEPPHRSRRGMIAALSAAATILVVLGIVTLAASTGHSAGHRPRPQARAAAAPPSSSPAVTPTTTATPRVSAQLIASNRNGASYSVEPSPATIELVPTSACWVQVRTGSATGPVTFQGTMHAGDRLPLPTGTPVWLRLGNPPGISIVVNGTPLNVVTPSVPQPYNLELQPAS